MATRTKTVQHFETATAPLIDQVPASIVTALVVVPPTPAEKAAITRAANKAIKDAEKARIDAKQAIRDADQAEALGLIPDAAFKDAGSYQELIALIVRAGPGDDTMERYLHGAVGRKLFPDANKLTSAIIDAVKLALDSKVIKDMKLATDEPRIDPKDNRRVRSRGEQQAIKAATTRWNRARGDAGFDADPAKGGRKKGDKSGPASTPPASTDIAERTAPTMPIVTKADTLPDVFARIDGAATYVHQEMLANAGLVIGDAAHKLNDAVTAFYNAMRDVDAMLKA